MTAGKRGEASLNALWGYLLFREQMYRIVSQLGDHYKDIAPDYHQVEEYIDRHRYTVCEQELSPEHSNKFDQE
jgi:hypothetical protein